MDGIPGRYSAGGKIRIVVLSELDDQVGFWDYDDLFYHMGIELTEELIDNYFVSVDSITNPTQKKLETYPEILRVNPSSSGEKKHYC